MRAAASGKMGSLQSFSARKIDDCSPAIEVMVRLIRG